MDETLYKLTMGYAQAQAQIMNLAQAIEALEKQVEDAGQVPVTKQSGPQPVDLEEVRRQKAAAQAPPEGE